MKHSFVEEKCHYGPRSADWASPGLKNAQDIIKINILSSNRAFHNMIHGTRLLYSDVKSYLNESPSLDASDALMGNGTRGHPGQATHRENSSTTRPRMH